MSVKTAGVIIIGDEILKGHVIDQNSNFLCSRFYALGIKVYKISVLPDQSDLIAAEVAEFSKNFDYVITSGGVGPTHDDVTYEAVAKAFKEDLYTNKALEKRFKKYLSESKKNRESVLKMIKVPQNSEIIFVSASESLKNVISENDYPIVKIFNVFLFPGVPRIMREIFLQLENEYFKNDEQKLFFSRQVHLNKTENFITSILNDVSNEFADRGVSFGSYPNFDQGFKFSTKITIESTVLDDCLIAESAFLMKIPPNWIIHQVEENQVDDLSIEKMQHFISSNNSLVPVIKTSLEIIEKCIDKYGLSSIFVSFNGGKDCTLMTYLIYYVHRTKGFQKFGRLPALYCKNPLSFPEEDQFVQETAIRYDLDLMTMTEPLKESLDVFLKDNPKKNVSFLGVRNSDPKGNNMQPFQMSDKGWPQIMRVCPVLHWNYKDVWKFLRCMNIPYCELYNEGYTSVGIQTNTLKNPALLYSENGVISYRPAYLLDECSKEREGRI